MFYEAVPLPGVTTNVAGVGSLESGHDFHKLRNKVPGRVLPQALLLQDQVANFALAIARLLDLTLFVLLLFACKLRNDLVVL